MNAPPPYQPPVAAPPSPPSKAFPTWAVVLLAILGVVFVFGGILSVLAVYGVRKYLMNAKNAEARNALGQIARDAATAYEENHALCPSASRAVPESMTSLRGTKYQSATSDWEVDRARNAGFACLKFSMDMPQYYQYSYAADATGFTATAHGDLTGDGKVSTFVVRGVVRGGTLTVAPRLEEMDIEE